MSLSAQWDLGQEAAGDIAASLNVLLADAFALLLKIKGCRWHVSGPHFQSHQELFRELEQQIDGAAVSPFHAARPRPACDAAANDR